MAPASSPSSYVGSVTSPLSRSLKSAVLDESKGVNQKDELAMTMNSVLTPLLAILEKRVIDHIDSRLQLHEESLEQLLAGEDVRQGSEHKQNQGNALASEQPPTLRERIGLGDNDLSTPLLQGVKTKEDRPNLKISVPDKRLPSTKDDSPSRAKSVPAIPADAKHVSGGLPTHLQHLSKHGADIRMDTMFPRLEDLKLSVNGALSKKQYDVEAFYKETGFCQQMVRSLYFQDFMLFVILLNNIWVAIETDSGQAFGETSLFFLVNNVFCMAFTCEIVVRFLAFVDTKSAFRDNWFVFDLSLAALMAWESWAAIIFKYFTGYLPGMTVSKSSQVFRMIRLVRLFRAARLLHAAPELNSLTNGLLAGVRSVMSVIVLLFVFIYVFAVVFTMLLQGNTVVSSDIFATVPASMNTLMLQVIAGPDSDTMQNLLQCGLLHYFLFLAFIFFSNLTLMNMLIGILCDVVSEQSADAKEDAFMKEVDHQIQRLAGILDTDGDGGISEEEFGIMICDPEMTESLNSLGVDIVGAAHFARFIYGQCDAISYDNFALLMGQFRGGKAATIKDVMDMRRYMTLEILGLEFRRPVPGGGDERT